MLTELIQNVGVWQKDKKKNIYKNMTFKDTFTFEFVCAYSFSVM